MLEDRAGKDIPFLAANVNKFMEAARKRPEIASINTTFLPIVPAALRQRGPRQGSEAGRGACRRFTRPCRLSWAAISSITSTALAGNGRSMFRPKATIGRARKISVCSTSATTDGESVPLARLTSTKSISGPEFTMRYNLYRSAQINGSAAPGYSSAQANKALEEVFAANHAAGDGLRLSRHVVPGKEGARKAFRPRRFSAFPFCSSF